MNRPGIQAQGDFAEQSRINQHQVSETPFVDLNKFSGNQNFPLLDLVTSEGLESIKGYTDPKKIVSYLCELQVSEKWASSKILQLRESAAKQLVKERQSIGDAWPKKLSINSGLKEVKDHIREETKVIVPDDKIQASKDELKIDIQKNPEIWNVDPNAQDLTTAVDERFQQVQGRIVGCGKTASEMIEHAETVTNPQTMPNCSFLIS